jgi:bacterioferritin-associated ferredoxin
MKFAALNWDSIYFYYRKTIEICRKGVAVLSDKTIICRCEDLTVEEIREWIDRGYGTIEEIKRVSRIGMGSCQGRTCRRHLINELARAAGKGPEEIDLSTFRPPTKPISFESIAGADDGADDDA